MDCERFSEVLGEETEGDVLPLQVRAHLRSCPACGRRHDSLRRGRVILRSISDIPVSDRFIDRLEQRIRHGEARRRVARRAAGAAGRLAVAGALAALVYLLAPAFAGRLHGPGHPSRAGERTVSLPAVRVLRPLSRLAGSAEASLFAGPADFETEKGTAGPAVPFARLVSGAFAANADVAAGSWASAGLDRWRATAGARPVLVTTPSWTFAAPPAAFHFVPARVRPAFPPPAR